MVLSAVHKSHSVVWLALHLWCGSWFHLHNYFWMEFWIRLWIWLLPLVLPMVGTDGLLRIWLVSLLWLGSVGRRGGRQRLRSMGQHSLFAHRRCVGESLHRQLWSGDARSLSQYADRQDHRCGARHQHQYLHGK